MVNIDMIDKELYNSIYISPRIGDYKEIWTRIRSNKEILQEAIQVTKDKFGDKDIVKSLSIAEFILLDYKNIDSNIYQDLINTIYSNTDIARIVLNGASNGGDSFLLMSLFNPNLKLTEEQKAMLSRLDANQIQLMMEAYEQNENASYDKNLETLGVVDLAKPSAISIYPKDFEAKNRIIDAITEYNNKQIADGKEENEVNYTDTVGLLMKSVTQIVDTISYVLIAFVAISLVVSSIMIGIITYISVLERTKEIGILRAIGASKKDISRVFNAETFIVGLIAGILGIVVTLLLNIPINSIIHSLTNMDTVNAVLPVNAAIILVVISMVLTIIAGLIPSRMASKKDPVEALRTE